MPDVRPPTHPQALICAMPAGCRWDRSPLLRGEPNPLLLFSPGIGQGLGKTGDREISGCRAIHNCCDDAGRQEGEGSEQADVRSPWAPSSATSAKVATRPSRMSSIHLRALAIAA